MFAEMKSAVCANNDNAKISFGNAIRIAFFATY